MFLGNKVGFLGGDGLWLGLVEVWGGGSYSIYFWDVVWRRFWEGLGWYVRLEGDIRGKKGIWR